MGWGNRVRVRLFEPPRGDEQNYSGHHAKTFSSFTMAHRGGRSRANHHHRCLELFQLAADASDIRRSARNDDSRGDLVPG